MKYRELSSFEEEIGSVVVNSAYKVHKALGPGLLEKVYEACLAYEISKAGFEVERQVILPIVYDEIEFKEGLRIDVVVERTVIIEVKAVDEVNPVWKAQVISQLKLSDLNLGYLINFNVPLIKHGIKRFIN